MKILLFANTDWYLYNYRLELAQALRVNGHEVVLVSPEGNFTTRLRELGFRLVPFPISRRGIKSACRIFNPGASHWALPQGKARSCPSIHCQMRSIWLVGLLFYWRSIRG